MRLTCVISSLEPGGSQKVMTFLAGEFVEQGAHVAVLSFEDVSTAPFFPLPRAVEHHPLGLMGESFGFVDAVTNNLRRIRSLRAAIRECQPDVVLSFGAQANILTILAAWRLGVSVVVAERCAPHLHTPALWRLLRRFTYPLAQRIVVQTAEGARAFGYHPRVEVIPNPVPVPVTGKLPLDQQLKRPCVVGLGRFTLQKRFDLLIDAFAVALKANPGWSLVLVGDGPERSNLERRIKDRGIVGNVRLLGYVKRPEDILSQADLFVLCSDYEGFPNALCEAMACGTAVISTDCPSGPDEIIRDSVDGLLVPPSNTAALSKAMARLMSHAGERARMGARAREVCVRFAPQRILSQWHNALDSNHRNH